MWKRDPVTATISGKLFSLLSFRAGWEADRLRACASSRLTSFIGRETEGRVRLFTTDALSEKQETTFQPGVKRDKSKKSMSLFDWNISCRGRKGAAGVARARRGAFCQRSLPSTQQYCPPECIPSRVQAHQPKAALQRLAASVLKEEPLKTTRIHTYPFLLPPSLSLPTAPPHKFWSSSVCRPNLMPNSFSYFYIFLLALELEEGPLKTSITLPS